MALPGWLRDAPQVRYVHTRPARRGERADFPDWADQTLRDGVARLGVDRLWKHQREAADAAFGGRHVALSTGTASGKTLAYLLPVAAATGTGVVGHEAVPIRHGLQITQRRPHTALYLAPTKALAHDQLRACTLLDLPGWRVSTLDGDSSPVERRFARDFAGYVLTNPDMLHYSVLPNHERWAQFLSRLRYVVIDEAHRYRGVFGAHVAGVLRRLRRLCRHHGSDPVFISASATVTDAGSVLTRLAGVDEVVEVARDTSTSARLDVAIWQPEEDPHADAAALLAAMVNEHRQTLTFVASRLQSELIARRAQQKADDPTAIASYRGGYLAEDRRRLERQLQSRELGGVACTNALELGMDISGVDAVISCGFPGTLAALWQQLGRAGRRGRDALGVLIARPDPLDAYLCEHPLLVFDQPVERTVLHPENPHVLGPHLAASCQELPMTEADAALFGEGALTLLARLAGQGVLRRRPSGWYWPFAQRAVDSIDLRSINGKAVDIIEAGSGRIIGNVDPSAADRTVHEGAIYLHQGDSWLVDSYDVETRDALVHRDECGYYTQPLGTSDVRILRVDSTARLPRADLHFGAIEMSSQVVSYLRRDCVTGEIWDSTPLDLPIRSMRTQAVWWAVDPDLVDCLALPLTDLAGAAHAAEHASIGLLPAFAPCDRWDIGGLSTVLHPDTGRLTVFVIDGQPGGSGFAARGFDLIEQWLGATHELLLSCDCDAGCPRCVVSPKCGNGNQPLEKAAAGLLLGQVIGQPTSSPALASDSTEVGSPGATGRTLTRTRTLTT